MIPKKRGSALSILFFIFLASTQVWANQTYTLISPEYTIQTDQDHFHSLLVDGYYSYAVPGYPDLPCTMLRFAVPPDVDAESITAEYSIIETEPLGTYEIRECPVLATWQDDQYVYAKKADMYGTDAYFPQDVVEYLGFSQMRKWKFVQLKYTPFQYNPVSGDLQFIAEVAVTLTYEQYAAASLSYEEVADRVMDERASRILRNFEEANRWYQPGFVIPAPSTTYDYVIITTNAIESSSTQLTNFTDYLSNKGYAPLVITEDEYGGLTGQAPNGTAEKIRKWLKDNYATYSIEYVLLIGNPDPDDPASGSDSVGDIPMKMCWPRRSETTYKESPTDYFYADLTGDWDLDGDGYFGEYTDDSGTGGVDFANEVYVGRIPVYSGVTQLDSVLAKTISYGYESDITWRKNALLPMSFSDASTDGAYLSEAMISNYLTTNGISDYTMYMQGSVCAAADSGFTSDQELVSGTTKTRWMNNAYGMVWWWGHGSSTGASLGYGACGWGTILSSSDTASLDDSDPAFVYQCSCNNGYPEVTNNLGTSLLYNGAITTACSSRVSWYAVTSWYTGLKYYCDNASIGYYYGQELAANTKDAAEALYDVKSDMGASHSTAWGGCHWMNLFDFNLYGDPAISLDASSTVYVEPGGVGGGNTPCFFTIQAGIDAAPAQAMIKVAEGSYDENCVLDEEKVLTLQGGWASDFTGIASQSTMNSLTIADGTITAENIVLESSGGAGSIISGSAPILNLGACHDSISPLAKHLEHEAAPGSIESVLLESFRSIIEAGGAEAEELADVMKMTDRDSVRDLIVYFYTTVLNRDPEEWALEAWIEGYFAYALSFGIDARYAIWQIGSLFLTSDEYLSRGRSEADFITDCYRAFLDREPGETELEDWLTADSCGGEVVAWIGLSDEFSEHMATFFMQNEDSHSLNFVTALSIALMDSIVMDQSLMYWSAYLEGATDKVESVRFLIDEIVHSEPFLEHHPNEDEAICRVYCALLARLPTESEQDYWAWEFESEGKNLTDVISELAYSEECILRLEELFSEYYSAS